MRCVSVFLFIFLTVRTRTLLWAGAVLRMDARRLPWRLNLTARGRGDGAEKRRSGSYRLLSGVWVRHWIYLKQVVGRVMSRLGDVGVNRRCANLSRKNRERAYKSSRSFFCACSTFLSFSPHELEANTKEKLATKYWKTLLLTRFLHVKDISVCKALGFHMWTPSYLFARHSAFTCALYISYL